MSVRGIVPYKCFAMFGTTAVSYTHLAILLVKAACHTINIGIAAKKYR